MSNGWRHRPLSGPGEFQLLRESVRDAWRRQGTIPFTSPGPVDWWRALSLGRDLREEIELWWGPEECGSTDDSTACGWTWRRPGDIEWFAAPMPLDEERDLRQAMLSSVLEAARRAGQTEASIYAAETRAAEMEAIQAIGGTPGEGHALVQLAARLETTDFPEPSLPPGYRIRPVDLSADLETRVEIHRAAFAPSKFTRARMEALLEPGSAYDPAHDLVIVAPDGTFAGFALGWTDSVGSVGEIEPLGVHPDHRAKGLATALVLEHMRRFKAAGLATGTIWYADDNPAAGAAYTRAGLVPVARAVSYALPL